MNRAGEAVLRMLGAVVIVAFVLAVLAVITPAAMQQYPQYSPRAGISCAPRIVFQLGAPTIVQGGCNGLADVYHIGLAELVVDSMFRSLALLAGAAVLALVLGTLLGAGIALMRKRAFAGGAAIGAMSLVAAIPSFFIAYFLQIAVIVVGASAEGGRLLPVFGFGYDGHLVLPLVAISLPAITATAQLIATRMQDVLDSDFVTTANAKGLATSWIVFVHVLPHVRPVALEALGSGLRVSVASLPVIEYLFNWRGSGQLAIEAIGVHDAAAFVACAVLLVSIFAILGVVADVSRPRALYRTA